MTSLLGADVSHWQSATPTRGLSFIFVKATQGASLIDPAYADHVARALAAGLLPGAYHFALSNVSISAQALWFVQHSAGARALVIDVEPLGSLPQLTKAQTRQLIAAVKLLDPLHRRVGLYMSEWDFYTDVGADFRWVAHFGVSAPSIGWDVHQYSNSNGALDLDRVKSLTTLNVIFKVVPPATVHQIHIAHGAVVRAYSKIGAGGCIASDADGTYGTDIVWWRAASSAPCGAPVRRATCDGKSQATTVYKPSGAFAGQHVRIDPPGVTVS